MSLEQAINNLADAINRLAGAGSGEPRQSVVAPGPDTDATAPRRRGRQGKGAAEETTAAEPVQETPPAEPPAEAPLTIDDVRSVLKQLRDKDGNPDRAKAIMRDHAGVEMVPAIPQAVWPAVVAAAKALLG